MHFLLVNLAAAFIPLIIGMIWYNPNVFGKTWMNAIGTTEESMRAGGGSKMIGVFVLTYVFSFFLAVALSFIVIHQFHMFSILVDEPGFKEHNGEAWTTLTVFMDKYGQNFRTFKHGAFHGTLAGITFALPIVAINAMFERRNWKYILINAGFWIVCCILMGGVLCQFHSHVYTG